MSRSAHTEATQAGKPKKWAREMGVSKHTIHAWKQRHGGLEVSEAQELKRLKDV